MQTIHNIDLDFGVKGAQYIEIIPANILFPVS